MSGHDSLVRAPLAAVLDPEALVCPSPEEQASQAARTLTFDEIYEQHFPFVWRSVRRLGVIDSAVDDVVQDVFLVVHRRLSTYGATGAMKSWLFGIVVRVVKDMRRTLRRKPAQLGGAGSSDVDVEAMASGGRDDPHQSLATAEAVKLLHVALDAMSEDRKDVFILAELEQMTVPEIAEAIGSNVNTTYSRLRAARAEFERAVVRARAADGWRAP